MPQSIVRHENAHLYAEQPRSEAGRALSEAVLHLRDAERREAALTQRISGLSSSDLLALRYLVQAQRDRRKVSPKDVMVMLDTSSATVTNVVERLVSRGFIEREQHPSDRRAHYLLPTEAAVGHVDATYSGHHSTVVRVIEALDEREAAIAADVLERIAAALDAHAGTVR